MPPIGKVGGVGSNKNFLQCYLDINGSYLDIYHILLILGAEIDISHQVGSYY